MTDTFGSEPQDHDAGTTQDGDAVHELPSEEEFAVEDTRTPPSAKSQRSPVLPIAAAVGGVFLLGAVAWWQFSGNSSSVQGFSADSFAIPSAPVAELPVAPPSPQEQAQPAQKTNLVEAPKESEILAPPPLAPDAVAPVSPAAVTTVPMGAPAAAAPTGASVPVPIASAEAVPTPPTPEQRIEALTSRIDTLQKSVDSLTGGSTAGGEATVPSYKELLDKVEKIEQKLSATDRAPQSSRAASEPKRAPKAKVERATQKKAASGLVLRAASNGQAWVSKSVNSTDLKEVQVGDSLPGIGRITDIKMQGDKWVIQGTKGTLQ